MIKKLGFCLLLVGYAAAFEMYDDSRAFGMDPNGDENYSDENYDYQELGPYHPAPGFREDPVQSLMLYQLFNSLQNSDDARLHMRYRPKFNMIENPLAGYGHVPYSELMDLKGAVAKRHAAGTAKTQKLKPAEPKQIKDEVKKVRKGFLWVCYFKLCSFRLPLPPAPAYANA